MMEFGSWPATPNKSLKPTPGRVPAFGRAMIGAAYLNR